jgi:peptidoglycan hydrolase-like protein with peptidoglycan-binding domain
MTDIGVLQALVDERSIVRVLRQGSDRQASISVLQRALYDLGFGNALNWDRYGPDGDYGRSTARAVKQFAARNGVASDGRKVGLKLGRVLIRRLQFLDEMHHMQDAVENAGVLRQLYYKSGARVAITVLQTILYELGYGAQMNWARYGADGEYGKGTVRAVKAFALSRGIVSDGKSVSQEMAKQSLASCVGHYGSDWYRESPRLIRESLTISETNRSVVISDGVHRKELRKFRRGLYTSGDQKAQKFIDAKRAELKMLGMSDSALNVMIGVSENEGNLDAINTWDNAFMTFGMFQWTIGTKSAKGELPALLKKIRDADADVFEKYYGRHGIDVSSATNDTYGHLVLNGHVVNTSNEKAQFRKPNWCFYFWKAGQDPLVQSVSLMHAFSRIAVFHRSRKYQIHGHDVADVVTSEYGIALVLDNHVNRPGYVRSCLTRAVTAAGLSDVDPNNWETADERVVIANYLDIRRTHGSSPMTDAAKRARVTKKYLTRGVISDERGSFKM